ncbi:hypothetical protein [Streptomyces sp. NPDC051310]|uniref:hypothetical protein n=1 Tax=Streptomyces sp. NPDC051310 TaxID=3365649 RepID=UPI0037B4BFB6
MVESEGCSRPADDPCDGDPRAADPRDGEAGPTKARGTVRGLPEPADDMPALLATLGRYLESHAPQEVVVLLREELARREFQAYVNGWRDAADEYEPVLEEARRIAQTRRLRLVGRTPGQAAVIPFPQGDGPDAAGSSGSGAGAGSSGGKGRPDSARPGATGEGSRPRGTSRPPNPRRPPRDPRHADDTRNSDGSGNSDDARDGDHTERTDHARDTHDTERADDAGDTHDSADPRRPKHPRRTARRPAPSAPPGESGAPHAEPEGEPQGEPQADPQGESQDAPHGEARAHQNTRSAAPSPDAAPRDADDTPGRSTGPRGARGSGAGRQPEVAPDRGSAADRQPEPGSGGSGSPGPGPDPRSGSAVTPRSGVPAGDGEERRQGADEPRAGSGTPQLVAKSRNSRVPTIPRLPARRRRPGDHP